VRVVTFLVVLLTMAGVVALAGTGVPADSLGVADSDSVRAATVEAMYLDYRTEFAKVPDVTPADLATWLEDSTLVLVDVRKTKEREVSVIPGSVTRKHYESHAEEYNGYRVVLYCTIGYRSGKYAEKLRRDEVDAWNLAAGILGWVHAGEPVESDGEPAWRVHVYGKRWSLLPEAYEAVW